MKKNYHKLMMEEIKANVEKNIMPKLLLHSCCAPCSSYVLQFLSEYFEIEVFFFNPNIYPQNEYMRRLEEQKRLVIEMGLTYNVVGTEHKSHLFYEAIKGYESMGEGSKRCECCFELRLDEVARYAKENKFDYFTTTLTISPMKNAEKLNDIGDVLQNKYDIKFLNSDFKKNNGYKSSVELSKEYNLYRQHYCGCIFSKQEQEIRIQNKKICDENN